MHDTFFLRKPEFCKEFPEEYGIRVKDVHEKGGYGSIGY
jgi:phenylalanyl-tRNA synthetase alpha chain